MKMSKWPRKPLLGYKRQRLTGGYEYCDRCARLLLNGDTVSVKEAFRRRIVVCGKECKGRIKGEAEFDSITRIVARHGVGSAQHIQAERHTPAIRESVGLLIQSKRLCENFDVREYLESDAPRDFSADEDDNWDAWKVGHLFGTWNHVENRLIEFLDEDEFPTTECSSLFAGSSVYLSKGCHSCNEHLPSYRYPDLPVGQWRAVDPVVNGRSVYAWSAPGEAKESGGPSVFVLNKWPSLPLPREPGDERDLRMYKTIGAAAAGEFSRFPPLPVQPRFDGPHRFYIFTRLLSPAWEVETPSRQDTTQGDPFERLKSDPLRGQTVYICRWVVSQGGELELVRVPRVEPAHLERLAGASRSVLVPPHREPLGRTVPPIPKTWTEGQLCPDECRCSDCRRFVKSLGPWLSERKRNSRRTAYALELKGTPIGKEVTHADAKCPYHLRPTARKAELRAMDRAIRAERELARPDADHLAWLIVTRSIAGGCGEQGKWCDGLPHNEPHFEGARKKAGQKLRISKDEGEKCSNGERSKWKHPSPEAVTSMP